MVRQYKIHTNLDGTADKVWDVTNGKVRFYQPSNLGLQSTNNIWQRNGIGVMGTRSITQPQIEFKLETFGESLEENYRLMKDFINDILNQKFVTLEYQTEIFQVYADLALADVTKTEGYGKNGTFSEKITFDIITKWYTYENLTFDMIKNGQVIAGKSKIYGGYKGSETALQNYNRLKASPSLNLPNLNLIEDGKFSKPISPKWNIEGTTISKVDITGYFKVQFHGTGSLNRTYYTASISNIPIGQTYSAYIKAYSLESSLDIKLGSVNSSQSVTVTNNSNVPKTYKVEGLVRGVSDTFGIFGGLTTTVGALIISEIKVEQGSTTTPYMPSSTEVTTTDISEYFGYNYIANQSYTYYGESNIERLSSWNIKDEIFSFVGILYPKLPKTPAGVRFLDTSGNEYTAIVFKTEQVQKYILVNTDVNDEVYQGWNGTTSLNLFPVMDFERYRTRIIEHGRMELINLTKAEFKVKRKADFV